MVGTAVYQVGCALAATEELQCVESGADDGAAGRERRQHSRDQTVDVEQRHDVQADVVRPE